MTGSSLTPTYSGGFLTAVYDNSVMFGQVLSPVPVVTVPTRLEDKDLGISGCPGGRGTRAPHRKSRSKQSIDYIKAKSSKTSTHGLQVSGKNGNAIYSSCTHTCTRTHAHGRLPCESKTFHSAQVQAHPPNRGVCTFIHGPFFGIWQLYNYQSSTCRAFFPATPHCPRSVALERRGL